MVLSKVQFICQRVLVLTRPTCPVETARPGPPSQPISLRYVVSYR
eukprot:COSAG06_NODE_67394_length_252_cov_0.666667_1_plen_44_part_10